MFDYWLVTVCATPGCNRLQSLINYGKVRPLIADTYMTAAVTYTCGDCGKSYSYFAGPSDLRIEEIPGTAAETSAE
jgi:hypothetical protein